METQLVLPKVNALLHNRQYDAAKHLLRGALEKVPDFFLYYESLGDVALAESDVTSARAAYMYALKLRPSASWISDKLTDIAGPQADGTHRDQGKDQPDPINEPDAALRTDPSRADLWIAVAQASVADTPRACQLLRRVCASRFAERSHARSMISDLVDHAYGLGPTRP